MVGLNEKPVIVISVYDTTHPNTDSILSYLATHPDNLAHGVFANLSEANEFMKARNKFDPSNTKFFVIEGKLFTKS